MRCERESGVISKQIKDRRKLNTYSHVYLATPPRARNRAKRHRATFMMAPGKGEKSRRGANGFVKKSAKLSALQTKGTVILSELVVLTIHEA
eukprot:4777145-Pleurochrysis_carterae.AAC.1